MKETINRRRLLKVTGGTVAGSFTTSGVTEASQNYGINLIQGSVEYELSEEPVQHIDKLHIDVPPFYMINRAGILEVYNERVSSEVFELAQSADSLVHFNNSLSNSYYSLEGEQMLLPTEHSPGFRTTKAISLAEPHELPHVELTVENDEVLVEAGETQNTVSPNSEIEISLPTESAKATFSKLLDERYSAPEGVEEWRMARKRRSWTGSVSVKPVVRVANKGKKDVILLDQG